MTVDDALKVAVYVLQHSTSRRLKAGEITSAAMESDLRALWSRLGIEVPREDESDRAAFAAALSVRLNKHVRETPASQLVIDGSTSGWKLGPRAGSHLIDVAPMLRVTTSKQHIGLAGEYAVMSELLLLDWNVAKPPFDNGVDIFATKDGEVRTVQVKTATSNRLGDCRFSFSGSRRAHNQYNNVHHYYVLVFRTIAGSMWRNSLFVCTASSFDRYLHAYGRFNQDRDSWQLVVDRVGERWLLNGEKDITGDLDQLQSRFS
jgi:hypothetical protein